MFKKNPQRKQNKNNPKYYLSSLVGICTDKFISDSFDYINFLFLDFFLYEPVLIFIFALLLSNELNKKFLKYFLCIFEEESCF